MSNGDILYIETIFILLYLSSFSLLDDHLFSVNIKTVEYLELCSFNNFKE